METQHERPVRSSLLLQMQPTSSEPQEPKLSLTQLAAQLGRPGICALAKAERRAKVVRVRVCMATVDLLATGVEYAMWQEIVKREG